MGITPKLVYIYIKAKSFNLAFKKQQKACVFCLSTTPTTFNVGMKDIWTGLVDVCDVNRTNLLEERLIFERKGGGAIVNYLRNDENAIHELVSFADESFADVHTESTFDIHSVDAANERVKFYLSIEREQSSSTGSSKVLTNHLNMGGILTQVIRITDLVGYTGMSFIVLGATAWTSALQHLLSPSMDSGDDPLHAQGTQAISTVAFLSHDHAKCLCIGDHVAWSSRTSLVT